MKPSIAFKTLGCRLNQYETDALASQFHELGYRVVDFSRKADVYIVNTCTVTHQSDQKSRNLISQAARRHNDALVVVTGCVVNNHKEAIEASGQATYVVRNEEKNGIVELVDAHFKGEITPPSGRNSDVFAYPPAQKTFHTRAMIKIQDGCDNFCTFCIIPKVRGRAISRPKEDILENARQLIDFGYKELVLTGVNIGRYDSNGSRFENLLASILELPGDFRVRISSIEPDGFGEAFYDLFHHPKLTPHLHLCLQSGSDKVLLRMRRMYSVKEFMEVVHKLRKRIPDFNFTTDVMVGFPGETAEDFNETISVVRDAGFTHIHTFRFSKREGTRAVRMDEQVPERLKAERSELIRVIAEEQKRKYRESLLGREHTILTEKDMNGYFTGYSEYYVPFHVHGNGVGTNQFIKITPTSLIEGEDPVLVNSEALKYQGS